MCVPTAFGDFVDRHEVVADGWETIRSYDDEFEVVEFGEREERFASKRGETFFPRRVFGLFFFERVKLF